MTLLVIAALGYLDHDDHPHLAHSGHRYVVQFADGGLDTVSADVLDRLRVIGGAPTTEPVWQPEP